MKCMRRWQDPVAGKGEQTHDVGPYSCARPLGHRGACATQGPDGSWALWQGEQLIMAVQAEGSIVGAVAEEQAE